MIRRAVLFAILVSCLAFAAPTENDQTLAGYSRDSSRTERDWENKFSAIPSPDNQRDYMKRLSAHPHHVGSPYDKDNAEWLLAKMKEWGLDAHIETFDVLFPTPKQRLVEMVEPTKFTASLSEPPVPGDPTSDQTAEQLPPYNAYSIDGDVTGPLVYVNYGVPDDYEKLDRLGISVKGAIVIARYGGSWRGIKPKVAAEHGAIGCLIYSDPRDDGYFDGGVFPEGPMRNRNGVQRGSVMDMPIYPGDPLTPGVGAVPGAKRLDLKDAKTITKIPVLPISYGDAQPLLAAMKGPLAPEGWRGALPLTYHVGPGPAKVHLVVKSNWDIKTLRDIIVEIPGAVYPDEWIIRGNHHDAWVNGAEDPLSGTAAELEEARGLSELLKEGWKPKRTVIYCLWDGEEPALLGSTEWVETHADELRQHAAVYINSDVNGRGFLYAEGSHSLEKFVNSIAKEIQDPEKKISVWKRWQAHEIVSPQSPDQRGEARDRPDLRIGALGSGSDYTAFLDHLGVASLNYGFGGEDRGGIYHSAYDDFYWFTHFSDTDFTYGRALSQTVGTSVMRLADADLLPFDFTDFADTVHKYTDELQKLLKSKQDDATEQNKEIDEGDLTANSDPKEPYVPPSVEPVPPHLNFAPLLNASDALTRSAEAYQEAIDKLMTNGGISIGAETLKAANANLILSERKLTNSAGLPGRPWFKHLVYAPGMYTGYGVKTIPGVREAIEQKQWKEAEEQEQRVSAALQDEANLIDKTAAELEKEGK
ncbi:MAG TPA: transferrin receptor-like dimerization domain-containing protein [Terriglobales bacterium]|nr:transferrin receptor-like dimerization domain-containing protein [Terriglobales bacterium]